MQETFAFSPCSPTLLSAKLGYGVDLYVEARDMLKLSPPEASGREIKSSEGRSTKDEEQETMNGRQQFREDEVRAISLIIGHCCTFPASAQLCIRPK